MDSLPKAFNKRLLSVFGEQAGVWLKNLPELRESLVERWSLRDCQPVSELSYNYLEYAVTDRGRPVVLKLGFPNPELETEIAALQFYNGQGAVRLIAADAAQGALLLERIIPGTSLLGVDNDESATRIAGKAIRELWRPAPGGANFPSVKYWCRGFERYLNRFSELPGPLPAAMVESAGVLAHDLLEESSENYLLHGDLHHGNILYQQDGSWITIDPKGVVGEPAFEVGAYLYNPVPNFLQKPGLDRLVGRRLAVLEEETGLDRKRMAAWSYCRAVLSAIWSLEDNQDNYQYGIQFAILLERFL